MLLQFGKNRFYLNIESARKFICLRDVIGRPAFVTTRNFKKLRSIIAGFILLTSLLNNQAFAGDDVYSRLILYFAKPFISLVFDNTDDTTMKNRILNAAVLADLIALNFNREDDALCKNIPYKRTDRIDVAFVSPHFPREAKPQHLSQIKHCIDALLSMIYSDKVSSSIFYRLRVLRSRPRRSQDALQARTHLAFLQLYEPGSAIHAALSLTEADREVLDLADFKQWLDRQRSCRCIRIEIPPHTSIELKKWLIETYPHSIATPKDVKLPVRRDRPRATSIEADGEGPDNAILLLINKQAENYSARVEDLIEDLCRTRRAVGRTVPHGSGSNLQCARENIFDLEEWLILSARALAPIDQSELAAIARAIGRAPRYQDLFAGNGNDGHDAHFYVFTFSAAPK